MYYGWAVVLGFMRGGGGAAAHADPPLEQGTQGMQKRRATAHAGTRRRKPSTKGDE